MIVRCPPTRAIFYAQDQIHLALFGRYVYILDIVQHNVTSIIQTVHGNPFDVTGIIQTVHGRPLDVTGIIQTVHGNAFDVTGIIQTVHGRPLDVVEKVTHEIGRRLHRIVICSTDPIIKHFWRQLYRHTRHPVIHNSLPDPSAGLRKLEIENEFLLPTRCRLLRNFTHQNVVNL
jgi:hypothetical protein